MSNDNQEHNNSSSTEDDNQTNHNNNYNRGNDYYQWYIMKLGRECWDYYEKNINQGGVGNAANGIGVGSCFDDTLVRLHTHTKHLSISSI